MRQEMTRWQGHQLDHMQIICTSLHTDNHASTSSFTLITQFFADQMLFLIPNQQCQSTETIFILNLIVNKKLIATNLMINCKINR